MKINGKKRELSNAEEFQVIYIATLSLRRGHTTSHPLSEGCLWYLSSKEYNMGRKKKGKSKFMLEKLDKMNKPGDQG